MADDTRKYAADSLTHLARPSNFHEDHREIVLEQREIVHISKTIIVRVELFPGKVFLYRESSCNEGSCNEGLLYN